MADERIDILIEARENVASAVAAAIAKLQGLDAAADRSNERMGRMGDTVDRTSDKIRGRFRDAINEVNQSLREQERDVDRVVGSYDRMGRSVDSARQNMEEAARAAKADQQNLRQTEDAIIGVNRRLDEHNEKLRKANEEGKKGWATRLKADIASLTDELHGLARAEQDQIKRYDSSAKAAERYSAAVKEQNDLHRETEQILQRESGALKSNTEAYERATRKRAQLQRELTQAEQRGAAIRAANLRNELQDAERERQKFADRARQAQQDIIEVKMKLDTSGLTEEAAAAEAMLDVFGRDRTIHFDTDIDDMMAEMAEAEVLADAVTRDRTIKVDVDAHPAIQALQRISNQIEENRHSIAQFDNQIRGLIAFMGVGLAQPLISALIGLGGQLIAVSSSAIMAGGAIGVGFTSGIAQALPMIGLFAGALQRVAGVMNAVQQHTLMLKQENAAAMQGTDDNTTAQNGLADALQGLQDAQENLTRARFEARRELQDLILAEKEAQIAAENSVLAQEDAQRTLQRAISTGDVAGVSRATLGVESAALDRQKAEMAARRASQDLAAQRAGSALAPNQGVQQAEQQVEQAKRAIDAARVSMEQANQDVVAGAANLQFFLNQLSDTEVELYHAIMRIRRTWNQEWRPVTDELVKSFTFAVDRVNKIMQDPELIGAAKHLAERMGGSMDEVTREFTSPKWIEFWEKMAGAAGRSLGPITDQFLKLSNVFRRIADEGRPLFRLMIELIGDAVDDFDKFVGRGKNLRDFFQEMGKHLTAWWNLGRAVLRLFGELIGSSAKEGLSTVRDFTRAINEAADWIDEHGKKMDKFWADSRRVLDAVASLIVAIGDELLRSFNPKSVEALGDFLERVVVPALGGVMRMMGQVFMWLEKISENDAAKTFLQMAIAGTIGAKVLRTFAMMFAGLFFQIGKFGAAAVKVFTTIANFLTRSSPMIARFAASWGGLGRAFVLIGGPIAAAIGLFVLLAQKFGVLDDIWEAFKDAARSIADAVAPSFEKVEDAVARLSDAFSGDSGGLGAVLKFVFVNLVKGVVIPAIKILGTFIGEYLGGALDTLAGLLNLVADIFTGDWDKIPGHLKETFGGVFRIMTAPIRAVIDFIDENFGVVGKMLTAPFRLMLDTMSGLGDMIADIFGGLIDIIDGWVSGDFSQAWDGIKEVILSPFRFIKNVLEDIVNTLIDIINPILGAIGIDEIGHVGSDGEVRDTSKGGLGRAGMAAARRRAGMATGGRVGFSAGGAVAAVPMSAGSSVASAAGDLINGALSKIPSPSDFPDLPGVFSAAPGNLIDMVADWIKNKAGDLLDQAWAIGEDVTGFIDPFGGGGPNIPLPFGLAGGGHVAGPGGVDVIPANLTRGEFVVTPHGESVLERLTGVPGILNWLAGRQRPAQGYATGGRVGYASGGSVGGTTTGGDPAMPTIGDISDAVQKIVTTLRRFSKDGAEEWNDAWNQIVNKTKRSSRSIQGFFTDMSKSIVRQIDKMSENASDSFNTMLNVGTRKSSQLVENLKRNFSEIAKTAYQGFSYIATATNKSLEVFDEKPINIDLPKPQGIGKASGGFIGQPGERGDDRVPAWLGRGEAVLNWAHQKVVDPAMRAVYGYGLSEMFDKTSAMHGKGAPGGFAGGGYTGPGQSGAGFTPVWNMASQRFGMTNYTGFTGHSMMTSSGNISDHYMHRALDMSNGVLTPQEDALSNFFKFKVPQLVKQLIWRDKDQFTGYPIGGHTDHVHLAMPDQFAFNESVTAKILSAAQKGLDFSDLLKGVSDGTGGHFWKDIPKVVAKGLDSPIVDMLNSAFTQVRDAANEFGKSIADKLGGDLLGPIKGNMKLPPSFDAINHQYQPHWAPDYGGETLAFNLVAALAEWAGMPGVTFAQIAKGESGLRPGSAGVDPGGTKGYGMWAITSPFADALVAPFGGYEGMWNPVNNAQVAKKMFDDRGTDPWYGTRYVTDYNAHYTGEIPEAPERKEVGGIVGKHRQQGSPVPVIAHAGEWVLNAMQQARLASASGMSVSTLKAALGFEGGPFSYAGGGDPASDKEAGDAFMSRFFSSFSEEFLKMFKKMFGADPTYQTRLFGTMASTLGTLQLAVQDWLSQITGADPTKLRDDEERWDINRGHRVGRRNRGVESDQKRAFDEAEDTMKGISKILDHVVKNFKGAGDDLSENIRNTFEGLTGDGGVLDSLSTAFDELVASMENAIVQIQVVTKKHGSKVIGRGRQGVRLIEEELKDLNDQLDYLIGEKGVIQDTLKKARRAYEIARREGDKEAMDLARAAMQNAGQRLKDINTEIASMQMTILEKMEERMQALVDDVNDDFDEKMNGIKGGARTGRLGIDLRRRLAEAMGFAGKLPNLAEMEINAMKDQRQELIKLMRRARERGNRDLARELEQQVADLQVSIVELRAQMIQDAQDEIERRAAHREAGLDIGERFGSVLTGLGATVAGATFQGSILSQRAASLTTQRDDTAALLQEAIRKGFGPEVVNPLRESLDDLNMKIIENIQAQYENTIAIRQASIDAISNRQGFLGGVSEGIKGIMESLATKTGTANVPKMVEIMTAALAQLEETGTNLRQQMQIFASQTMGILSPQAMSALSSLQGLHGEEFVSAVMGLNLNEIINSLGGPDSPLAQQFQALLQAIIDNESALQANTNELQALQQQSNIQQFTSTAWQWFRQAMFTGMGGLMPNLQEGTPYYKDGGFAEADGPAFLHAGELVVPARFAQYARQLLGAGQMAGRMSTGAIPTGDLAMAFATSRAATIQGDMAARAGAGSVSEYAKLREALLKSAQNNEFHFHGRDANDDRHLVESIAFRTKVPTT